MIWILLLTLFLAMKNEHRRAEHRKPPQLEELLHYFEQLLLPLEENEISRIALCNEPILYIMGCARSGTTLVYQYLSQSGIFTYPTNFVSRFYYAPYIGAKLQKMLLDADFSGEIFNQADNFYFESRLGKTKGAKSPHEFWYFWRRFFTFGETQELSPHSLSKVNKSQFIHELRAFQSVDGRPLVLKGMILNWHIPFLAKLYEKSYFLFVKRSLAANADSLIRARQDFFGDINKWYSFKPPGYDRLIELDPFQQTVGQVIQTNTAIERGISSISPEKVLVVDYEDFCKSPQSLIQEICSRWNKPLPSSWEYLPQSFEIRQSKAYVSTDWEPIISKVKELLRQS